MAQVLIRNLDAAALEAHRRRAKALGHSLEQQLRGLIEFAAAYTVEEKLAIAEHAQSLTPARARSDAVSLALEDRGR